MRWRRWVAARFPTDPIPIASALLSLPNVAVPTAEASAAALSPQQRLQALAAPAQRRLRMAALCVCAAGALLVPQAAAIAWAVQGVFAEAAAPALAPLGLLLICALLRAALGWLGRWLADDAVETIRLQLRRQILRRLFARGPLWLRQQRSGAVAELMGTHADALEGYYGGFWLARMEVMIVPLLLLLAVFAVDRVVGGILLLTMPLIPLFMMLGGWGAEAASRRQLQALTRMGGHFADRLRGLGLIRLYGRAAAELAGVHAAAEELRLRSLKVLRIAFLSSAVMEFFASLSVAMIALYLGLSYLGMLNLRGALPSLGVGVFCLLLAPEFYAPLRRLATHYHDRAAALAAVGEIETALAVPDGKPGTGNGEAEQDGGHAGPTDVHYQPSASVQASHVFLRPHGAGRDVLADLSFSLAPGQWLALAGPSGCGKSTLLEALAGWLPCRSGRLALPAAERIGYAPQRPYLFHGSLADNLRLARPDASWQQLRDAAAAAQVLAFAERLPQGLDTVIGERGFGLSGGEARRVALARLFLRDPALLLLDEPTAFLDPLTEAALLAALNDFAQGRTLVIATHSEAAMRMAGQVLWLPEGRCSAPPPRPETGA
ncbi:thiol reductant ABC exporter subunit CydD [Pseudoxanthomonas wuyuanensis]|uniref:thiol reductant ABC exporter subunit CydD n=1 Tax=Pseudoxanthomonas wuyuanensis TaxID=1073196 RepID=UPI0013897531|nr:thiol reductant ABC exporter subunit CydD [Pseudoxanthomonas wuyuanensis]